MTVTLVRPSLRGIFTAVVEPGASTSRSVLLLPRFETRDIAWLSADTVDVGMEAPVSSNWPPLTRIISG